MSPTPAPAPTPTPDATPVPVISDGTVSLNFGKAGTLTGIFLLGNTSYGPNGEEVSALIPVGDDFVQVIVPARLVVK